MLLVRGCENPLLELLLQQYYKEDWDYPAVTPDEAT